MAASCTTPVESTQMQDKTFSAKSREFVPKSFSAKSREFVPSWKRAQVEAIQVAENTEVGTSPVCDEHCDQQQQTLFSAKSKEFVPKSFSSKSPEFVPKSFSAESREFVPKRKTWNKAEAEEIAPSSKTQQEIAAISLEVSSDPSDEETRDQGAHSDSSEADNRSVAATPKTKKLPSPRTPSTCVGSPTAGLSADDASSTSSVSGSSRSHSPAPEVSTKDVAAPLGLQALLQWRHATPVECPDAQLPTAAEPEPGTREAAAANAAKAATMSGSVAASVSLTGGPISLRPASSLQRVEDMAPPARRTKEVVVTSPCVHEEKSWRNVAPAKKLEVSDASWAARQRDRRSTRSGSDSDNMSDEDVVRAMKSILNKLTVEKFDSLSAQIMNCGIRSAKHLEQLIAEVFEKATTQHHFIDMYADLCTLLNQHRIIEDPKMNFKKILLNCCQASFEKNLTPPSGLSELSSEDRTASEFKYKMRMIGNIRFVGALLVRKMLASKVMLSIMEVLLQDPTPEALESLAAFLMVVGPSFDTQDWAYRATLNAVFTQIGTLAKTASVPSRIQCLLKDVIDVRNLGWQDRRPKKIEGPLKLNQVAAKAAVENGGGEWAASKQTVNGDDWAVVGGARLGKTLAPFQKSTPSCTPAYGAIQKQGGRFFPQKTTKDTDLFKKARDREEKQEKKEKKEKKESKKETAQFDQEGCRAEISATLAELQVSHDVPDAIARIAEIGVPISHQPSELCAMLAHISEEGSQEARKVGFGLVVGLFLEHHWKPESAEMGMRRFVEETCADLKFDVPTLPQILCDELHPALAPLPQANLLSAEIHDSLISVC